MYSLEQRKKAVELYIEYSFHEAKVIKELGYPSRPLLMQWIDAEREGTNLRQHLHIHLNVMGNERGSSRSAKHQTQEI